MIKIDEGKTIFEGKRIILCAEIACLFDSVNQWLDGSENAKLLEESIIFNEESYKNFCRLALRLNEAHKRNVDLHKAHKDKNK